MRTRGPSEDLNQTSNTMFKKLILSTFAVGLSCFVFGQWNYGFRLGVARSKIDESLARVDQHMNFKTGIQFGAIADINLLRNLNLRPAVQLTQKGYQAVEGKEEGPFYWYRDWVIDYLEFPLDVIYELPVGKSAKIFLGTGPVVGIGLFGKGQGILKGTDGNGQLHTEESTGSHPFRNSYKKMDLGADLQTGIRLKNVVFTAGYNYGLLNILNYDHGIQTTKNRSFSITVGYFVTNHQVHP